MLVGCGGFELPDPPDMSALVRDYQHPDGELDSENVEQVATEIKGSIEETGTAAPIELTDMLVDDLETVGGGSPDADSDAPAADDDKVEDVGAGEQSVLGNKIDLGARVKLHRICRGWEDTKRIDEDENGTFEVTATLDRRGLIPTVWGRLDHCRVKRGGMNIELTGDIRVRFGTTEPRVGLKSLKRIGYLVELDGTVRAMRGEDTEEVDTHVSFQVFPDGTVRVKVGLPDETHVLLVVDPIALRPTRSDPMLDAGVVARDKTWACTLNLIELNGRCADEVSTDSVVQW